MTQSTGAPSSNTSTPEPVEPQRSEPTTFLGAPHIGTDTPAWDDMPGGWRDAFGSNR